MADGIRLKLALDDDGSVKIDSVKTKLSGLANATGKQTSRMKQHWKSLGNGITDTGNQIRSFASSLPGLVGAAGFGAMFGMGIKGGIAFNAELESIKTQYQVIIGDSEKANALFQETLDFSARTPFQMDEVARARKMLVAFGLESVEALTNVGDAAAASGRPIEEMALVLGRIKSGAFGEAFMRLAETGLATREMLEMEGLTFDKQGSFQGTATEAITAVQKIISERYGGMMDEMSRTWRGSVSTMLDNWNILRAKVTEKLFETLKPKINEITEAFKSMIASAKIEDIGQKIANVATLIIDGARYAYEFRGAILGVAGAFTAVAIATGVWNAVSNANPWAVIAKVVIAGLGAVVGWLIQAEQKTGFVSKAWLRLKTFTMDAFDYMKTSFSALLKVIPLLPELFKNSGDFIKATFMGLGTVAVDYFTALWNVAKNTVTTIGDIFRALGTGIKEAFSGNLDGVKGALGDLKDIAVNGVRMSLDEIQNIGAGAFDQAGEEWGKLMGTGAGRQLTETWDKEFAEFSKRQQQRQVDLQVGLTYITTTKREAQGPPAPAGEDATETTKTVKAVEEFDYQKAFGKKYKDMWGETMKDVGTIQAEAFDVMEGESAGFFERFFIEGQNLGESFKELFVGMAVSFSRSMIQMGTKWTANQIKMSMTKRAVEAQMTTAAIAGSQARLAASTAETAASSAETSADTTSAVAKTYKAHSHIPFVGALIAGALVGVILAGIAGSRRKRLGGLHEGTGTADSSLGIFTPGEYTMPRNAVQTYGTDFMDSIRDQTFAPREESINLQFNVTDSSLVDDIEETIVPELERLIRQRRMRT
jgi:hypothetical protein